MAEGATGSKRNLLASILSGLDGQGSGGAPQKKAKLAPQGTDRFQLLVSCLEDLHRQLKALPADQKDKVEVEARIGTIKLQGAPVRATPKIPGSEAIRLSPEDMAARGWEFLSGVSEVTLNGFKDHLPAIFEAKGPAREYEEEVFTYGEGRRITRDADKRLKRENKVRKYQVNLMLPAADYDLRITASVEETEECGQGLEPNWTSKRHKSRASWQHKNSRWQLDLTEVDVTERDKPTAAPQELIEVELEVTAAVTKAWLGEQQPERVTAQVTELAKQLVGVADRLNPLEPASSITGVEPLLDEDIVAAVRTRCSSLARGSRFPGAMPVNICRRDMKRIRKKQYYVCEKTDGVRYLLMVVDTDTGPQSVLVDRVPNCFKVDGGAQLAELLGVGTVLDGELVHNRTHNRAVFMIFDMLAKGGEVMMHHDFEERFLRVTTEIEPAYKQAVQSGALPVSAPNVPAHLPLVRKIYFTRCDIMRLFGSIHQEAGGDRVYVDSRSRDHHLGYRHHKTDGVIFQPNTPYAIGTDRQLLKWKWLDLASIDLRVRRAGDNITAFTELKGEVPVEMKNVELTLHDKMRLLADMGARPGCDIAELALDHATGQWRYMGMRSDKNRPNFIDTVQFTMQELAEGIEEEELQFTMMMPGAREVNYKYHLEKVQKQLVVWQDEAIRLMLGRAFSS